MVQRFEMSIWEKDDGDFVYYHDYAHLEAENARLKEALRECVKALERFGCFECKPETGRCELNGDVLCPVVTEPQKARKALGDGPITDGKGND